MRVHIQLAATNVPIHQRLLYWTRNILFAIGMVALGEYAYSMLDARIYQSDQAERFQQALSTQRASSSAGLSAHVDENVHEQAPALSPTEVKLAGATNFHVNRDKDSALGRIEIPRIGIAVMIVEGTDNRALARGVGHILKTAMPGESGNIGIAGHRDSFFRNLNRIEKNDEIVITTLRNSQKYLVDYSEVVGPDRTEVLSPSNSSILTLVTCYPPSYIGRAPKRLIVRAHMIPEQ